MPVLQVESPCVSHTQDKSFHHNGGDHERKGKPVFPVIFSQQESADGQRQQHRRKQDNAPHAITPAKFYHKFGPPGKFFPLLFFYPPPDLSPDGCIMPACGHDFCQNRAQVFGINQNKVGKIVINRKRQGAPGNEGKKVFPKTHANGHTVQRGVKIFYHRQKEDLGYFKVIRHEVSGRCCKFNLFCRCKSKNITKTPCISALLAGNVPF